MSHGKVASQATEPYRERKPCISDIKFGMNQSSGETLYCWQTIHLTSDLLLIFRVHLIHLVTCTMLLSCDHQSVDRLLGRGYWKERRCPLRLDYSSTLKADEASASEIVVNCQQITGHHIPEVSNLYSYRHGNIQTQVKNQQICQVCSPQILRVATWK